MPVITFSSSTAVTMHPQAKLLGWHLLSKRLNRTLNDAEISVLEKGLDEQSLADITSLSQHEQYALLLCAVVSKNQFGSIQELFHLAKETLKLPSKMLAEIFILAGDTALIASIFSEMSDEEIWDFVTGSEELFLKELARRGLLPTLTFLLDHSSNDGNDIKNLFITDNNFYSFACENGLLDFIQYLEGIDGFDRKAAAEVYDYSVYLYACQNGHLAIVQHLESIEGFDKNAAAQAWDYCTYLLACKNGHIDIIEHLQQIPSCLSYAEKNDHEYGKNYVYPFITSKLTKLAQDKNLFETNTPNDVFDVDGDTAQFYFVVLRNLIRRGVRREYSDDIREAENLLDEIRLLLSIPSVKALCHQRIDIESDSPGSENELLKLAQRIGNQEAAAILLALPDVYRLAEQNNFYQNEVQNGPNLSQIEQDIEFPVVAIPQGEQATVDERCTQQTDLNEPQASPSPSISNDSNSFFGINARESEPEGNEPYCIKCCSIS